MIKEHQGYIGEQKSIMQSLRTIICCLLFSTTLEELELLQSLLPFFLSASALLCDQRSS
ncbi:hypothetical protein Syun_003911 [Stephania yunnanensis]|uniref:Uncharacterized protein n=1 Tax=Stephania yunnanensis TaxID=152371 RepID=A0AAP0L543_9MAGN